MRPFILLLLTASLSLAHQPSAQEHDRVPIQHALTDLRGNLNATLVEVTYAPGFSDEAHSHACPVIGYVVSGSLRFQVNSDPAVTFHAGDTFYEPAHSVHRVSANASSTEPVTFVAFFVCEGTPKLTTPVSSDAH